MKQLRIVHLLLLMSVMLLTVACGDKKKEVDVPATQRTLLVYMAANNNPALPHEQNLNDIVSALAGKDLAGNRVLVFLKTETDNVPRLIEVTSKGKKELKRYSAGLNTVAPDIMRSVLADMRAAAPAEEYGLVLWSHASGWRFPRRSWGQDVDYTEAQREMSIPDLADALSGQHLKFIYMDCCFMGNIETLYELRNTADYIMASASETPWAGMDYARNIPAFLAPSPDYASIVLNTFEVVSERRREGDECGISIALYRMAYINRVRDAVKAIYAEKGVPTIDVTGIQQYGFGPFWRGYFYDLKQYMAALNPSALSQSQLSQALVEFMPVYRSTPKIWDVYPLIDPCALSAFIPGSSSSIETTYGYADLAWYTDVVAPYRR